MSFFVVFISYVSDKQSNFKNFFMCLLFDEIQKYHFITQKGFREILNYCLVEVVLFWGNIFRQIMNMLFSYTLSIKLLVNPSWAKEEQQENETSSLSSSVNLVLECELVPGIALWMCYPKTILTAWKNKKEINKNRIYDNNLKLRIVFRMNMFLKQIREFSFMFQTMIFYV